MSRKKSAVALVWLGENRSRGKSQRENTDEVTNHRNMMTVGEGE